MHVSHYLNLIHLIGFSSKIKIIYKEWSGTRNGQLPNNQLALNINHSLSHFFV